MIKLIWITLIGHNNNIKKFYCSGLADVKSLVLRQRHYQTLHSRKSQQYSVSSTFLSSLVIDIDHHLKVSKELRTDVDVTAAELVTKCNLYT